MDSGPSQSVAMGGKTFVGKCQGSALTGLSYGPTGQNQSVTSQEFYHDCCSRTRAAIKSAAMAFSMGDYPRLNSSTVVPAWDSVRSSSSAGSFSGSGLKVLAT